MIIPIHNKAAYLEACLQSVLAQHGVNIEVICLDDCSTDGSAHIVRQFAAQNPTIRVYQHDVPHGAAGSRNAGIELARGRFLQFTDADDLLPDNALTNLVRACTQTGAEVARGTLLRLRDGIVDPWPTEGAIQDKVGTLIQLPELWIPWFHFCYLMSADLVKRGGIRYPNLVAGEDPVFMAHVLTRAHSICTITRSTYVYRLTQRSQPQYRTVSDYIQHARSISQIFVDDMAPCWEHYRAFIKPDIELLLSQANLTADERWSLTQELDAL